MHVKRSEVSEASQSIDLPPARGPPLVGAAEAEIPHPEPVLPALEAVAGVGSSASCIKPPPQSVQVLPQVVPPPQAVPLGLFADSESFARASPHRHALETRFFGVFRLSLKGRALQARCPFRKLNNKTGCKKPVTLREVLNDASIGE